MLTSPDFSAKKILFIFSQDGEKISFKNDNIIVLDKDNNIKVQLSCWLLFSVFIVGGMTITTGIIEKSKKFGFSIVFFNVSFKVYSSINYSLEGNTLLREKQYKTKISNKISKQLIINKIENQKEILKKIRSKSLTEGINILNSYIDRLNKKDYSNYEIMGIEGVASKVYFNRVFKDLPWNGRQPKLKKDAINLLLDIGYTILFNYIEAILNLYGFDIYKGNLHQEFYKRKSLVCDIIEPFRPIIDYKIKKMYNLKQIKKYDFKVYNNQYQLSWNDASDFVSIILKEIMEYKHTIFLFIQQYYRWFMKEQNINGFPKAVIKNDIN